MNQKILGRIGAVCALVALSGSAVAQAPLRPGMTDLPASVGARIGTAVKPKAERLDKRSSSLFALAPGAFFVMVFAGAAVTYSVVKVSKSTGSNPPASPQ